MEIVENKLSDKMLSNVKDVIADAFKYKTTKVKEQNILLKD